MAIAKERPIKDVIEEAKAEAAAETQKLQKARSLWPKEYAEDTPECLIAFVINCRTWDEAKKKIRDMPRDKAYIQQFCRDWWECRRAGRTLYVRKCRRMIISWTARACELWALGMERQDQMLGGDDYEAAAKHCWRIAHLYKDLQERFPAWRLPDHKQIVYKGERALEIFGLPNGSTVNIINAKSTTIQGEGTAIATFEELGLYDDPAAVLAQAQIVCEGDAGSVGGFVVAITNLTRNPRQALLEKKELGDPDFVQILPGYHHRQMSDGSLFVLIEYKADPAKDSAWLARLEQRMKRFPSEFRLQILMVLEGLGGALWKWATIDQFRLPGIPKNVQILRTVIALDPSVTDLDKRRNPSKEPDETGIVVVAMDSQLHAYVRFDLSGIMSTGEWAQIVMRAARLLDADVVYEENQGKHLVERVLRPFGPNVKISGVVSTVGKRTRAEPVVIPYEMGHVHHVGSMPELETQMTTWDSTNPAMLSPGRLDALVIGLTALGLCQEFEAKLVDNYIDGATPEENEWNDW